MLNNVYRMSAGPVNGTAAATEIGIGAMLGGEAVAESPEITQFLLGRASTGVNQINSGILNSNPWLRMGAGWNGVENVFRISVGAGAATSHYLDWSWPGGAPPVWPPFIVP
jgi:hypothetical protein